MCSLSTTSWDHRTEVSVGGRGSASVGWLEGRVDRRDDGAGSDDVSSAGCGVLLIVTVSSCDSGGGRCASRARSTPASGGSVVVTTRDQLVGGRDMVGVPRGGKEIA